MHGLRPYLAMFALLAAPLAVLAQCPNFYEVEGDAGKAWLGMNAGGFIAGEGQTFQTTCAGQITQVRFDLILDGLTWYGVPPLASGDVIVCEIMTPSGFSLASRNHVLDFDVGTRSIAFDFTADHLDMMSGTYLIACYPLQAKQARMSYHQSADIYAEGLRYISSNGSAGPWTPAAPENGDLAFKVIIDGFVPAEQHSWGQVKSLYR